MLLGSYHAFVGNPLPRKSPIKTRTECAAKILVSANYVFENWPISLEELFAARLSGLKNRCIKRQVGFIYLAMHRELKDPEFKFAIDALDHAITRRWPEIIDRKSPSLHRQQQGNPRFVSGTELSRRVGLSMKRLVGLIREEKLVGSVRTLPSGNRQITVEAGQEGKILGLRAGVDLKRAGKIIGLPKACVRKLLRAGLIKGVSPRPGKPWVIEPEELEAFRCRLEVDAKRLVDTGRLKNLNEIARYYLPKQTGLVEVLMMMIKGALPYGRKSLDKMGLAENLLVNVDTLRSLLMAKGLLSIPELAQELRVKQEVAYHLVRRGVIEATDQGRLGLMVRRKELEAFKRRYVWARDLSKEHKTSPGKLVRMLEERGVKPVSGPAIDGGRQYVYVKNEVVRTCIKKIDT
ncbi:helix-turn-helix domain-containing protein [Aestuariirhabdus litorea]|nr:helix-turn-helix domain-containing protein [Aestuariirhabdus litorea]